MGLSYFAAVTQLMRSEALGNDVRNVPGKVIAAFRRSQANLLKAATARTDDDIRSAVDVLTLVDRIGAKKDPHGLRVEAVVEVAKNLIEVVGSEEQLVGKPGRKRGVQHPRIIENMDWCDFKVVFQVGTRRSQSWATA